jgi:DNA-binding CsgD family transcriptional regulator
MAGKPFDNLRRVRLDAWWLRYGAAFVAVVVAWASRERFLPAAAERSPFVAFGLAILITSLLGGFGPGLVATGLASLIAVLFYLPPYLGLAIHAPFDLVLLALFVLEGLVAATAGGLVRSAIRREEAISRSTLRFAQFVDRAEILRRGPDARPRDAVDPLTPREVEVARLLALGLSNEQIASVMFVSVNTIKTHLKRIYDKLGVESRTEAVARCVDLGLLATVPEGDASRFLARDHQPERDPKPTGLS